MSKIDIPVVVDGHELRDYFMEHVVPSKEYGSGFYFVYKPLHAFKICRNREQSARRLVNLVIPVGAHIFGGFSAFEKIEFSSADARKMRASKAYVHSIEQINVPGDLFNVRQLLIRNSIGYNSGAVWWHSREASLRTCATHVDASCLKPTKVAHADYSSAFIYRVGETVVPRQPFSPCVHQCMSGIHFFLNLRDALVYV